MAIRRTFTESTSRMMRTLNGLIGRRFSTLDGELGRLHDVYFEDRRWQVLYLVAELWSWYRVRFVLVNPQKISRFDGEKYFLQLTRSELKQCPDAASDKPISIHEKETLKMRRKRRPLNGIRPYLEKTPIVSFALPREPPETPRRNRYLRSCNAVKRYTIFAGEQKLGPMRDFLIDDRTWTVRFLVFQPAPATDQSMRLFETVVVRGIAWMRKAVLARNHRRDVLGYPSFTNELRAGIGYEEFIAAYERFHNAGGDCKVPMTPPPTAGVHY
jgi:hypothetical protein